MYTKTNRGWLKHLDFEIIDILALEIAYWLTYFIRHKGIVEDMYLEMYIRVSIVIVVIDIATLFFSDNYKGIIQRLWQKELIAVIQHVSTVNVVVLFYLYLMQESELMSRTVFILLWPIGIFLSFGARLAWKRVIRKRIRKEKNQIKLLLLSTEQHAVNAIKEINNKAYREYKICGIAVPDNDSDDVIEANIPILYGKKNVIEYIKRDVVDAVYIDTFKDKDGYYVFHAGTKLEGDKVVTNGGRVLGVTAKGKDLPQARANAYEATKWIDFDNKYMRHDIGKAIDEVE